MYGYDLNYYLQLHQFSQQIASRSDGVQKSLPIQPIYHNPSIPLLGQPIPMLNQTPQPHPLNSYNITMTSNLHNSTITHPNSPPLHNSHLLHAPSSLSTVLNSSILHTNGNHHSPPAELHKPATSLHISLSNSQSSLSNSQSPLSNSAILNSSLSPASPKYHPSSINYYKSPSSPPLLDRPNSNSNSNLNSSSTTSLNSSLNSSLNTSSNSIPNTSFDLNSSFSNFVDPLPDLPTLTTIHQEHLSPKIGVESGSTSITNAINISNNGTNNDEGGTKKKKREAKAPATKEPRKKKEKKEKTNEKKETPEKKERPEKKEMQKEKPEKKEKEKKEKREKKDKKEKDTNGDRKDATKEKDKEQDKEEGSETKDRKAAKESKQGKRGRKPVQDPPYTKLYKQPWLDGWATCKRLALEYVEETILIAQRTNMPLKEVRKLPSQVDLTSGNSSRIWTPMELILARAFLKEANLVNTSTKKGAVIKEETVMIDQLPNLICKAELSSTHATLYQPKEHKKKDPNEPKKQTKRKTKKAKHDSPSLSNDISNSSSSSCLSSSSLSSPLSSATPVLSSSSSSLPLSLSLPLPSISHFSPSLPLDDNPAYYWK